MALNDADALVLDADDLSATFRVARDTADSVRRRYEVMSFLQLVLLVLAAFFGGFSYIVNDVDVAAYAALAAFLLAGGIQAGLLHARVDEDSLQAQYVADEAESLAWRYSVGAMPFPRDGGNSRIREHLAENLRKISDVLRDTDLVSQSDVSSLVTPAMTKVREKSLAERIEIYRRDRIQAKRLAMKAVTIESERLGSVYSYVLLLVPVAAALAAVLKIIGFISWDVLGLGATVAAALTAWVQLKRYRELHMSAMQSEMLLSRMMVHAEACPDNEEAWARIVDKIERTICPNRFTGPSGPERPGELVMSGDEFYDLVNRLKKQVFEDSEYGRFEPDVILAVNAGGAVVGGILYLATRRAAFATVSFRSPARPAGNHTVATIKSLKKITPRDSDGRLRVLIVDSVVKSGESLRKVQALIDTHLAECEVEYRTAVLVHRPERAVSRGKRPEDVPTPDYYVSTAFDAFPYGDL